KGGRVGLCQASGNVTAGNDSRAGGLVAENTNNANQSCDGCQLNAKISHSYANGDVTVGNDSVAGGLVAINKGTIGHTHAAGAVMGGDNSILAGLVGVNDLSGLVKFSMAMGTVAGTGPNNIVGGLVGVNVGEMRHPAASAQVGATPDSSAGGVRAINIAIATNSRATEDASVTVTGKNSTLGGFVGVNRGMIAPPPKAPPETAGSN